MTTLQKMYIDELDLFCAREYGTPAYTGQEDLEHIGVLYTTHESYDEETDTYGPEVDLQVWADISDEARPALRIEVDGREVFAETYEPLDFLKDIEGWTFDCLYSWALDQHWKEA